MRVLHVYKTYYPDTRGGVEQAIFQICESCRKFGIESEVLTLSSNPIPEKITIGTHQVTRSLENFNIASTGFSFEIFKNFQKKISKFDLVHYHYPWPLMDLMHFFAKSNKPSIVSYHSDIVKQKFLFRIYQPLMRKFMNDVDLIIAASPNYAESSPHLRNFTNKIKIIPYGLDQNFYDDCKFDKKSKWTQKYPEGFFLFVGVLRYYKGLHLLLKASQNRKYPILIAGDGPMHRKLRLQALDLKLDNVHFLGAVEDEEKFELLRHARCIVFPSNLRSESFGISLLEGAMFGKPMISSEIGTGTSYININGITGIVTPPNDPISLQEAMDNIWNNTEMAESMGKAAKKRFDQLFTSDLMGKLISNAYHDVVSKKISQHQMITA